MKYILEEWKQHVLNVAVDLAQPVLLIGETGTGKTTIVAENAKASKRELIRISVNDQLGREDLIGKWGLQDGTTVWSDGPLIHAMRKGHWIVLDEINAARPEVLFALHAILDDEKAIVLNEKDSEKVQAHKNFRLFASMNPPTYQGVKQLNEALLSRFTIIPISILEPEKEIEVLRDKTGLPNPELDKLMDIASHLRKQREEGNIEYFCSTRDLIATGHAIMKGIALPAASLSNIFAKMSSDDMETIQGSSAKMSDLLSAIKPAGLVKLVEDAKKVIADAEKSLKEVESAHEEVMRIQGNIHALELDLHRKQEEKAAISTEIAELTRVSDTKRKEIISAYLKTLHV